MLITHLDGQLKQLHKFKLIDKMEYIPHLKCFALHFYCKPKRLSNHLLKLIVI